MSLIATLSDLQRELGWLPREALERAARQNGVPLYAVQAVASFYPHFHTEKPRAVQVAVCRDVACHLRGSGALRARLERDLASDDVEVRGVSCLGRCDAPPAVAIRDEPLCGDDPERIAHLARNPDEISALPPPRPRAWPFPAYEPGEERYSALREARSRDPKETIAALKDSGLRGMGGAAFPCGVKWELVAAQEATPKYVICNADESEPGTFKDRVILAELPHLVLEGVLIAAHAIGARKAIVFIRHEYEPERRALSAELERVRAAGVLGGVEVEIFVSPGGYILGEETALLECLEDRRGEPRNKPPFPGQKGLFGKPTLINNVETFAAAAAILKRGVDWWRACGRNGCHGYKFMSVCGDVERPDVYQVEMGTTVRELIEMAGGVAGGAALKAFSPGGASSAFLPASAADAELDFERMKEAGSMLGSGALFVVAEGRDMLEVSTNVARFFRNESCGKCVPCRVGSEKAVGMLDSMLASGGSRDQLETLRELAHTLEQTSICGLGQVALLPVISALDRFGADVAKHVRG